MDRPSKQRFLLQWPQAVSILIHHLCFEIIEAHFFCSLIQKLHCCVISTSNTCLAKVFAKRSSLMLFGFEACNFSWNVRASRTFFRNKSKHNPDMKIWHFMVAADTVKQQLLVFAFKQNLKFIWIFRISLFSLFVVLFNSYL